MKTSKDMPPHADAKAVENADERAWYPLVLIFAVLALGIFAGGAFSYRHYERRFRTRIEEELAAITELKVAQIVEWRRERLINANYFWHTPYVARRALDALGQPASRTNRQQFIAWIKQVLADGPYEQALLVDERLKVGLVYPQGTSEALSEVTLRAAQQALSSRQLVVADLHRETEDGPVYLSIVIPFVVRRESTGEKVQAADKNLSSGDRSVGLLVLQVNVQKELYPMIRRWPTPSRTAETLLVRRDGNDALVLNEPRSQTNTALKLRLPLERTNQSAVKAALGQQGIVDASDYRGVPVVAALRAIPGSPWSLVARMDLAEVYAPLRERLWLTVLLMGALLLGAGASVGLVWRQQRVRFYKDRAAGAEATRETNERLGMALEVGNAGVWEWNLKRDEVRFDAGFHALLGYTPGELPNTLPEWLPYHHPEDIPVWMPKAEAYLRGDSPVYESEHRIRAKAGTWTWVLTRGMLVKRTPTGAPEQFVGIAMNVTGRKQAEEAIRESEKKFRALFENMAAASCMDEVVYEDGQPVDYRVLDINPAFERITGISRSQAVGSLATQLYGPGKPPFFDVYVKVAETGEPASFEAYHPPIGKHLHITVSCPARGRFSTVFTDITERKRADLRVAAFSQLGQQLSAAKTAREAAEIIVEVADHLLGWDACALDLYSPEKDRLYHVLNRDIINGQRVDCPGAYHNDAPSPRLRRTIEGGGQLILRDGSPAPSPEAKPFGDTTRPSASIMIVPIRDGSKVIGVFSLHSYTPKAYDQQSLDTLQTLADHCAGALKRISAQEALSASEANHRALVESSPDAIFLHREGKFLYANPATLKLLRAGQPQQLLGRSVFDIVLPENHDRIRQRIQHAAEGGMTPPLEQKLLRLDGTSFEAEGVSISLTYEGKPAVQSIIRDITERKNLDRRVATFSNLGQQLSAAKTAREAAEIIVEVADQLLGWDACNFALYSPATKLILHVLNRATVDGRRIETDSAYNHSPPSPLANRVIMEGGQLILKEDPARMQPGGLPFGDTSRPSASLLFVPIRNGTDVIGVMSIQSYTPKAYNQQNLETLQALADHCGGALDRITTEETLRTAQEQLRQSQKMEAVGQLAGGVAHEVNNMLAVIRGNAELLLMDTDQLTAEASAGLEQVVSATDRAAGVTRQLLAFSRKQLMQSQPLLLSDVIANFTKMLNRVIREDICLQCSYAPRLPFIQADPGMMEQVLLNLVVNARDAMPRGGQLLITTDTASFDAAHAQTHPEARAGEFVCLTVSDTGTGIAPEHLPRIFEPFFTTKELGQGTGLGLAMVYGIVKQHRGWIEVSSQLGAGATFKIFLPTIPTPARTAAKLQTTADLPGGTETILLVEDDDAVRMITRRVLESRGYKVCEAASAPEALELWRSRAEEIALVLSDVLMPEGVTGRDLAEQLRASRSTLKVILISGYSADVLGKDTDYLHRTKTGFLQKPFSARALLECVRRCLDAK